MAVHVASPELTVRRAEQGIVYLEWAQRLGPYPRRLTECLEYWGERAPDRPFLAQRDGRGGWRQVSYRETLDSVRRIGQALLDRRLSNDRPVVILSGNSIEHALLALAAMHVGILYAPIAPAYSLQARDHGTL